VTDADPPHEVDDGEAPSDRDGHAPDADAFQDQVSDGVEHHHRQHEGNAEAEEPSVRSGRVSTIALIFSVTVPKV